jgi:hypothetical protein
MPRTSELPGDLDPEELDEMIRDLGREKGLPSGIHPDLVGPNLEDHDYWGCGQQDRHRQSCIWRRKLITELKRRPEWIAEWRADAEMDRRIEELCKRKGLNFAPHECPPWQIGADEQLQPMNESSTGWDASKPLAQRLRRQLEAELERVGGRR